MTRIYGVPGEENADLLMALEESGIRMILTRHEQAAAAMAAAEGRLTGRPGVCLATLGPGATNLVTGVADAHLDGAPLLAITGQAARDRLHKESHQVIDTAALFSPVTAWSHTVLSGETIPEVVRRACGMASTERPGAVHIALPEDVAGAETGGQALAPGEAPALAVASRIAIEAAARHLAEAERPVLLVGPQIARLGGTEALAAFAEAWRLPTVTTFMGKGALDARSERHIGTVGLTQTDHADAALRSADLVVAAGIDLVEYPPRLWAPECGRILHLNAAPAETDAQYRPRLELVGDPGASLRALADRATGGDRGAWARPYAARMAEAAEATASADADAVPPQALVAAVRRALASEDIVCSGVGAHKMWIGRHYPAHAPHTCLIPNGFCAMGIALPQAIGAALCRPGRRAVALCGDGDLLMNLQDMETATRLGVDLTVVVWVDGGYGLIAWKQREEFGRTTDLDFANPDWEALAAAFGWRGEVLHRPTDLESALARAVGHPGPALLAVPVDYAENAALSARLSAEG